jgi:hypothetical protein
MFETISRCGIAVKLIATVASILMLVLIANCGNAA